MKWRVCFVLSYTGRHYATAQSLHQHTSITTAAGHPVLAAPAVAASHRRRTACLAKSAQVANSPSTADSSSSSSSGGRFSKFTSGSSWRSSSPIQEQQQQPAADAGQQQRFQSSWDAVEAGGGRGNGADYLFELGQSDFNTNVDAGQNRDMIDSLFTGNVLGHKSDIADGSLRGWEFRSYNNIIGDYYIAPSFMDKVTVSEDGEGGGGGVKGRGYTSLLVAQTTKLVGQPFSMAPAAWIFSSIQSA
jgi:hypothetical protein